jgi:hypothetical protein
MISLRITAKRISIMPEETMNAASEASDDTDLVRWATWQRTVEMVGRIRRKPGITWEQVDGALSGQTGYVCTPLKRVYNDDHEIIATLHDGHSDDAEDEGFTLGEVDK